LPKQAAHFRLLVDWKEIHAQIRAANRIGFLDDQLALSVETRCSAGKGEPQQQPEESENRGFNDSNALVRGLRLLFRTAAADAVADFEASHNPEKKPG